MTILNNNICKKPTNNLIFYEIIQLKKDHYKNTVFMRTIGNHSTLN